jgi:SSS family solute:Na+ symporter
MQLLDWFLFSLMLVLVAAIAAYTQRFVKGVADFLAAGRVAGRYVVAVSSGEAAMGLMSIVTIWNFVSPWPQARWVTWFFISSIVVASVLGVIYQADIADDGRVEGGVSTADLAREAHSPSSQRK